jgi:hypothetical protein
VINGIVPLTLVVVILGACGNGQPATAPTPCASPQAISDTSAIPRDIPVSDWGTVTKIEEKKEFLVVQAVSDQSVVELHPQIARSLLDSGYEIVGADNEGFESEIFFAPGKGTSGLFRLREGPCKDQLTVTLLIEGRKK